MHKISFYLFTFSTQCHIIESSSAIAQKERNDNMSNFEINDIVKCMCNEGMEHLLVEGEYYVVADILSTPRITGNIVVELLGNETPNNVHCKAIRFDKVDSSNKEDVRAIINKRIDPIHPHVEVIKQLVGECSDKITREINEEIKKLLTESIQLSQVKPQSTVSQNLSQILNMALSNTSEEEVLNSLYQLLPLSEIKLGARYKHIITEEEYYLIQDSGHNPCFGGMNYYLLIDANTHKSVGCMQEGEYSMQLLIRNMGLQLQE